MLHQLILAQAASEGTGDAAASGGMSSATLAVLILLAALGAFAIAYFVVGPGRPRRRGPEPHGDIPLAMRPHYADEDLETTGLERAMAWGVALAAFAALFLPTYWLIEPARINNRIDDLYQQDVAFGREQFAQNCTNCHGENAQGGFAPHPDPNVDAPWPAPALDNIVARYQDSDTVSDVRQFMIETIKQGRPGTPMPSWGAAYNGPMNDQQVESIVDYLLSIQTGKVPQAQAFVGASGENVFQDNCARCHGQNAEGYVGPSLVNVFERYGASPDDPAATQEAVKAVKSTIENGRYIPTGAPMPAWKDVLSEDAINAVIEYLQSIQR